MNYIVTGGLGFIGSNLVDDLINRGHQVLIYDDLSTGKMEYLNPKAILIPCRVEEIKQWITKEPVDAIFHLAAQSRIQPSFSDPYLTHCSNVSATANVLEFARKVRTKVIFAGTSCAYHDAMANPYAFTKNIGEQYCRLYADLYGVSVVIARFFNVYGPRQMEEGTHSTVVGIFERQKRNNMPLTITGTGEKRRDFIHVKDIVSGLIAMALSTETWHGEAFNLGSGINFSIKEVAEMFKHPIQYIPDRPGEAQITLADIELTKDALGWEPIMSLKDYINSVV
jgi:nucleoside-diphosphate-sugar epimerase